MRPAIRALPALDRAVGEKVDSLRRLQENRARMKGKVRWALFHPLGNTRLIVNSGKTKKLVNSPSIARRLSRRALLPQTHRLYAI